MSITINQETTTPVELKSVKVTAKVRDSGTYEYKGTDGQEMYENDGYVPDFFPEDHFGDYLELEIDLESGQILNWKKPTAEQLQAAIEGEDD